MNKQQIFDDVATHLLTQNAKSMNPSIAGGSPPSCAYRGPDGTKCAIGALIPDNLITDAMDLRSMSATQAITHVDGVEALFVELYDMDPTSFNDTNFFNTMQQVHDNHDPDEWLDVLSETAAEFDLHIKVLR